MDGPPIAQDGRLFGGGGLTEFGCVGFYFRGGGSRYSGVMAHCAFQPFFSDRNPHPTPMSFERLVQGGVARHAKPRPGIVKEGPAVDPGLRRRRRCLHSPHIGRSLPQ